MLNTDAMALDPLRTGEKEIPHLLGLGDPHDFLPSVSRPTTRSVELGRFLFFDKRLSGDGTVACSSCHLPSRAFTDRKAVSTGIKGQRGRRNAPTVVNRLYGRSFFWDGRARTLTEQTLEPFLSPVEHGLSHNDLLFMIRSIPGYRRLFRETFDTDVTAEGIATALTHFQWTILSGNSPVDRFDYQVDGAALPADAQRGFLVFRGKAGCVRCHAGPNYTDEQYHNLGVGWESTHIDLGRYSVTRKPEDMGAFKTPTLREVARTAPYMHDGRFRTLDEVVNFYNHGGVNNPHQDPTMKPLFLSDEEREDLVTFLKNLSGEGWQHAVGPRVFPE
ncbi:MAG TPA: cytochrome c peroxidase [Nitrospira sp.]|nr:cytochrome c peroxidase [Nitrospira sp.]